MTTASLRRAACALVLPMLLLPGPAQSAGLWDAGLLHGGWRSDLPDPAMGTSARPLSYAISCPFPGVRFAICPGNLRPIPGLPPGHLPRVFERSNWVERDAREDLYWVVSANVEPALDSNCNSGPPNQSEPVLAPFEGIFGLDIRPARELGQPWRKEAVLAVDLGHRPRLLAARPQCQPSDYIPYLSIGVHSDRGNDGEPLALLAPGEAAPLLRFELRVVDSNAEFFDSGEPVPPRPRGQHAGLLVEAQWSGRKRWVWIDLLNTYALPSATVVAPWNWTLRESMYYPGAEIVVTSSAALQAECGAEGLDFAPLAPASWGHGGPVPMQLDLERLYDCVGQRFGRPRPTTTAVPITGVQFFVEVGVRDRDGQPGLSATDYDSRLGIAVGAVDIVPATGSPVSSDEAFVTQLGIDLLGREWSAQEHAHWMARIAAAGRSAMAAEALHSLPVRRTAIAAARLGLISFGDSVPASAFEAALKTLRAGASYAEAARAIVRDDAFMRVNGGLDDAAFVRATYRRTLRGELEAQPDAAEIAERFGSIAEWTAALRSGKAGRDAVLLNALHLASARELLRTEAEIVVAYRSFLAFLPDRGGVGYWRSAEDMPERLLEVLYHTRTYRRRFEAQQ